MPRQSRQSSFVLQRVAYGCKRDLTVGGGKSGSGEESLFVVQFLQGGKRKEKKREKEIRKKQKKET